MRTPEGKTWQRIVTAITLNEDKPVFIFYDSISGNENNIWSMMMMSEGAVETPAGAVTPEKRMYNYRDVKQQQLPSATPVKSIPAGWNRFAFNGQSWKKHISGGIDWYLYTNTSRPVNFTLSQWGTNWLNVVEAAEFRKSNGREYTEEQQILRVQNNEPFFSVLLPFTKGDRSYEGTVTTLPGKKIQVKQATDVLTIDEAGVVMKKGNSDLLALLRSGKKIDNGRFFVEGGIMGLEYSKSKLVIRVHGKSGIRTIRVPFGVVRPQTKYGDALIKSAQGNTVITIDYKNNKTDLPAGQKGYTEYIFAITE